jgi:putative hydrolase of the HAD superfamily
MKTKYTHLLIDLDHTLWDFNENCKSTILDLYDEYQEVLKGLDSNVFFERFLKINNQFWHLYDLNKISKDELRELRFRTLLHEFGIKDFALAAEMEEKYIDRCPKKGKLLPYAFDFLEKIKSDFEICLITNGFQSTQEEKVKYSGLDKYFANMFTSESTLYKKPDSRYFEKVLEHYIVDKRKCLIIGDNPHTDIQGAKNSGIDSLWVNTQSFPKSISCNYYVTDIEAMLKLF